MPSYGSGKGGEKDFEHGGRVKVLPAVVINSGDYKKAKHKKSAFLMFACLGAFLMFKK
jgi:hypothetical protein